MEHVGQPQLRVGFVGGGYIARRHRNALAATGKARAVAVADLDKAVAQGFAEIGGARVYGGHDELLDRERLDALYICVPPGQRGPIEKAAIARGLPFFAEKPLGTDLEVPMEIADAVADAGLVTGVGYHWRQLDSLDMAMRAIASRPAHLAVAQWHDGMPRAGWWRMRSESGGQIVEQATHLVDVCQLVFGEPVEVQARETADATAAAGALGGDVPSATVATLRFASGAVASLVCSYAMPGRHRVQVEFFCEGEALLVTEESLTVYRGQSDEIHRVRTDPLRRQAEAFITAVRGGPTAPLVSYRQALAAHRTAVQLDASARGSHR